MITESLPCAYGGSIISAMLRESPEDFIVEEVLGFEPEGEGEHVFLWIEKTGQNTQYVAEQLSRFAKVHPRNVSYSGMKDRRAVTRQWFGVHLPGKAELDWQSLNDHQLTIHKAIRHPRKLRRGVHKGNRFSLRLTHCEGDFDKVETVLQQIQCHGFPNYFGEQRFGRDGRNIEQARRWFAGSFKPKRKQQGIYLSAARSLIFNQVLARRVADNSWNQLLTGELIMLNGTHSVFAEDGDTSLSERLSDADIHPTGPLYGKPSDLLCDAAAAALEEAVFDEYPELRSGLEKQGVKADRRALRVIPDQFEWMREGTTITLNFFLPSGCFATALVRELAQCEEIITGQEAGQSQPTSTAGVMREKP